MKLSFKADSVQIRNSKVGEEVTVSFTTGLYEWDNVKDVLKLNGDVIYVIASDAKEEINQVGRPNGNNDIQTNASNESLG